MRGEKSWEGLLGYLAIFWIAMMFMNIFVFTGNSDVDNTNSTCIMRWVECQPDDLVGDCQMFTEKVITGPYYNQTEETKVTLRKEICVG